MELENKTNFLEELRNYKIAVGNDYQCQEKLKRFKVNSKGWNKMCAKSEFYGIKALEHKENMQELVQEWSEPNFGEKISKQYIDFLNLLNKLELTVARKNRCVQRMAMYGYVEGSNNWKELSEEIDKYDLQVAKIDTEINTLLGYIPKEKDQDQRIDL